MVLKGFLKNVQKLMHDDPGTISNKQIIRQLSWLLFLKVYDYKEKEREALNPQYKSVIPEKYRWRNWTINLEDDSSLTGRELLKFINEELIPSLKKIECKKNSPMHEKIVYYTVKDIKNYSKDGYIFKAVIIELNSIKLSNKVECDQIAHEFKENLMDLFRNTGTKEFFTPIGICDFIAETLNPKIGNDVMDFCCGTGGLLKSILELQSKQIESKEDYEKFVNSIYGIEKNSTFYILCIINLLLHGINEPHIYHQDAFEDKTLNLLSDKKFKTIVLNPPFEGSTDTDWEHEILENKKLEDNFLELAMEYLDDYGQAAIIMSDDFFTETGVNKRQIKEKLFKKFNLHTIIRLPPTVFAPYSNVKTNILFFCNNGTTKKTWFYRLDLPEGYKSFSLNNPIELKHFKEIESWIENKHEIEVNGNYKAKKCSIDEIKLNEYRLNYCNIPYVKNSLPPEELIDNYLEKTEEYSKEINKALKNIKNELNKEE
ncbi:N-6 DNA methylase [Methanobrevibacter acididurans]|uniref:class I SAM-dependent DNA methyltransferase n=1 Tax=Methanobrevibacter acididurans TaxID=120963 RepID=UPI0038FC1BB6